MRKLATCTAGAVAGLAAAAVQGPAQAQAAGGSGSDSLAAVVMSSLEESSEVDAASIEVEDVSEHAVELTGTVSSMGDKQRASAVAIQADGVDFVRNDIEVGSD